MVGWDPLSSSPSRCCNVVWLELCRSGARALGRCGFLGASVLVCLESTVSLESVLSSQSPALCVFVCLMCVDGTHGRSKDNLQELTLSSHHVEFSNRIQVFKGLYSLSHLTSPPPFKLTFKISLPDKSLPILFHLTVLLLCLAFTSPFLLPAIPQKTVLYFS